MDKVLGSNIWNVNVFSDKNKKTANTLGTSSA